jgi:hypothetical protein
LPPEKEFVLLEFELLPIKPCGWLRLSKEIVKDVKSVENKH